VTTKPNFDVILVSTDEKTGWPSVFHNMDDVNAMYRELGWDGNPRDDGIMPVSEHIAEQKQLGLAWDADDWLHNLRDLAGTAFDGYGDEQMLVAIRECLD
jgi:hypothetical protein